MFGYGDEAPVPDLGLPRNGRLSLMEEVDDLIGSTACLTQSPAGHLSPSAKRSKDSTGLHMPVIRLVLLVFLCDFLLLTMVVPILPIVFKNTKYASPINLALVFASKPVAQILINPCAGAAVDKFGPRRPLLVGSMVATAASSVFILALLGMGQDITPAAAAQQPLMKGQQHDNDSYHRFILCAVARIVQGLASAFTNSSGFTLLVQTHHEDVRGSAVGVASIGIALGALLGPPLAGVLGSYFTWLPFAACCGLLVLSILLQLCTPMLRDGSSTGRNFRPNYRSSRLRGSLDAALLSDDSDSEPYRYAVRGSNLDLLGISGGDSGGGVGQNATADIMGGTCTGCRLLRDPMILIVAAAATIANATVGMIEPLIPLYMERTLLMRGNTTAGGGSVNATTSDTGASWEDNKTRTIGLVFGIATFSYLLLTPLAGWLGDQWGGGGSGDGGGGGGGGGRGGQGGHIVGSHEVGRSSTIRSAFATPPTRNRRYMVILLGMLFLAGGLCSFWLMGKDNIELE